VTGLRGRQQRGTALNLFQRYVLTRLFCLSGGRDSGLLGGMDGSTLYSEYSLLFPNRPSITYEKALNDLTNLTKGNNSLLGALPMVGREKLQKLPIFRLLQLSFFIKRPNVLTIRTGDLTPRERFDLIGPFLAVHCYKVHEDSGGVFRIVRLPR